MGRKKLDVIKKRITWGLYIRRRIRWGVITKMRRIRSLYNADDGVGDFVGLELVLAGVIIQVGRGGRRDNTRRGRGEVVIATRRMRREMMRMGLRGVSG
jgi:hypothetical protein